MMATGMGSIVVKGKVGWVEKEREVFLLLRRFADGLGQGFLQEELAFCDYVITVYGGYLDKKRAECPVKRKLGRAMVLLGGGMILLFFL